MSIEDQILKLTLDDIVNSGDGKTWRLDDFITMKEYDKSNLDNLDFSEKELSDFGYYIISRLYAFYKRNEI
jgi:hypothetical protein